MSMHEEAPRPALLIIDDHPHNVQNVTEILNERYDIFSAEDAESALESMVNNGVDLILLAITMQHGDGFEILHHLREADALAELPLLLMGQDIKSATAQRALEMGVADFVSLPLVAPILRARIERHLAFRQQSDMLDALAVLDPLTGLPNRRHFEQTLDREWRRAIRAKDNLSLILIHVDQFNDYADRYGYPVAEELLQQIAEALGEALLRATDLVAYLEDATFVAILPEADQDGVAETAERLRTQAAAISRDQENYPITISLGCATTRPGRESEPAELLDAADNMLDTAISEGRNRVRSIYCGGAAVMASVGGSEAQSANKTA